MKKIVAIVSSFVLLGTMLLWFVSANGDYTAPTYQPPVHNESLNFQATYQNGAVYLNWKTMPLPAGDTWKYMSE